MRKRAYVAVEALPSLGQNWMLSSGLRLSGQSWLPLWQDFVPRARTFPRIAARPNSLSALSTTEGSPLMASNRLEIQRVRAAAGAEGVLWFMALCGCVLVGFLLSRGGLAAGAAIGLASILAVVLLVNELGWKAVPVWVVLTGPAFPFAHWPSQHFVVTFDRVWVGAMMISLVLSAEHAKRPTRWLFGGLVWLVAAVGIRALLTSGNGPQLNVYSTWFDAFVIPCVLFAATRRATTSVSRLDAIAKSLVVAGVLLSLIGIAEFIGGFSLATYSGGTPIAELGGAAVRSAGPFSFPEMQATALLICFAATFYLVQVRGPTAYSWGALALTLEVAGIGTTLFRAAWIGAIIVIVICLGLRPRRFARLVGITALMTAFVVAALGPLENNAVIKERVTNSRNIYGRFAAYIQGREIFEQHSVFGVGVNQFAEAQKKLPHPIVAGVSSVETAHDSYIDIAGEDGLWGLIPLLFVTAAVWRLLRWYRRSAADRADILFAAAAVAAALAYLLMSLTLTIVGEEIPNAFLAVILGAAAGRVDGILQGSEPQQSGAKDEDQVTTYASVVATKP